MIIHSSKTLLPNRHFADAIITIDNGKIVRVDTQSNIKSEEYKNKKIIDFKDNYLVPGFIDIHIHGGAGSDFMDAEEHGFEKICKYHLKGGTTSLLATTTCATHKEIINVLKKIRKYIKSKQKYSRIIGVHLEGPYFNINMRGCHLPEYVRNPVRKEVDELSEYRDVIKTITIAPEISGAINAIKQFSKSGIIVSIGHSNATYKEVISALNAGARHSTHIYNAMSNFISNGPHRIPGVVESILCNNNITTEFIADGLHINQCRMNIVMKMKTWNKVCLITDAMRGAGMPDGLYAFGSRNGKKSIVKDGISVMPEGTGFASSVVRMNDVIKGLVNFTDVPVEFAFNMASLVPATILGINNIKGKISEEYDADLVVLNKDFEVMKVLYPQT